MRDSSINACWLKSDVAKKKCLSSRTKTYFNLDHSQSEALLEWNDKVLDETSKFSVQDFVLGESLSSEKMRTGSGKDKAGLNDDVESNVNQNNREDEYYRMNGQSSTREPQYPQSEYQQQYGQYPQQAYEQQQYGEYQQPVDDAMSSDSPPETKKRKGLQKSKFDGWANVKARNHFISKVFLIVLALLIYNLGIMCLFIFIEPLKNFAIKYWWVAYVFGGCALIFAIVLGCCRSVSRKFPVNYVMLFFVATFLGLFMGCISASYEIDEVLLAVGITILIVLVLAIVAIFSPCDFTMLMGVLIVVFLALGAFGIMMIFFYSRVLHIVYCSIGILVCSLAIVIDIQMICGGKNRRYQYSEQDYALAALSLYIDVMTLVMMVLGLTGAARG